MQCRIFREGTDNSLLMNIQKFRKEVFVDRLGWKLNAENGLDRDEFDRPDAVHCALFDAGRIAGTFRAIRCDRPYLSARVFPYLASYHPYPTTWDAWEISRFAVSERQFSWSLYATMFAFGWSRHSTALVAVVDIAHERFLRSLGIDTQRYGAPAIVGFDLKARPIQAVAGEIPMINQSLELRTRIQHTLEQMDMSDETLVLGSHRVSA